MLIPRQSLSWHWTRLNEELITAVLRSYIEVVSLCMRWTRLILGFNQLYLICDLFEFIFEAYSNDSLLKALRVWSNHLMFKPFIKRVVWFAPVCNGEHLARHCAHRAYFVIAGLRFFVRFRLPLRVKLLERFMNGIRRQYVLAACETTCVLYLCCWHALILLQL